MSEARDAQLFDVRLEQSLIGWFLIYKGAAASAAVEVTPADFYDSVHAAIVEQIFEFDRQDRPITPLTINTWLKHVPAYVALGGIEYLANCAAASPALSQNPVADQRLIAEAARTVVELRFRREALAGLTEASEALRTGSGVADALGPLERLAADFQLRTENTRADPRAGAGLYELLTRIERQATEPQPFSCSTGLEDVDEILSGGLRGGSLYIIGGRPGMGKSIIATAFARSAAARQWRADIYSLEMSREENAARIVGDLDFDGADERGIKALKYSDLLALKATVGQMNRALSLAGELSQLDVNIFDRGAMTAREICALAAARSAALPPGKRKLNIVDHLHLVQSEPSRDSRRVDELSLMTKAFKRAAKRLDEPFVILCQLNRNLENREDKRPTLADFRESGAIEEDADVVMGIVRPEVYAGRALKYARSDEQKQKALAEMEDSRRLLELLVLKNRHGKTAEADPIRLFVSVESAAIRTAGASVAGQGVKPALKVIQGGKSDLLEPLARAFGQNPPEIVQNGTESD